MFHVNVLVINLSTRIDIYMKENILLHYFEKTLIFHSVM